MKLIVAVIQPIKLQSVRVGLDALGVRRYSVGDAMGYARQRGHAETYRGHEYQARLLRKVVVEATVNDHLVDRTIDCIGQHARTGAEGHVGDGKAFVLPVEDVIQISDGRRGPPAV